jgi:hypothetical protein
MCSLEEDGRSTPEMQKPCQAQIERLGSNVRMPVELLAVQSFRHLSTSFDIFRLFGGSQSAKPCPKPLHCGAASFLAVKCSEWALDSFTNSSHVHDVLQ